MSFHGDFPSCTRDACLVGVSPGEPAGAARVVGRNVRIGAYASPFTPSGSMHVIVRAENKGQARYDLSEPKLSSCNNTSIRLS